MPGSKAGLQLSTKDSYKELWDIFSFFSLSILLYISLYLPPPIFRSFSIRSSLSPGITNTSAGGRITDKSPGVLDSATLAGARHIPACRTSCRIGLKNQSHKAPSSNTIQYTVHIHKLTADDKGKAMCYGSDYSYGIPYG